MGLTLYRPAYGAKALQGSILNSSKWINFWGAFILVSCRLAILFSADAFCRSVRNLNFYTHFHLSTLRQPKGKPRKYPTGLGFGTVVCANYWFETLGVLALLIMTGFDFGSELLLWQGELRADPRSLRLQLHRDLLHVPLERTKGCSVQEGI